MLKWVSDCSAPNIIDGSSKCRCFVTTAAVVTKHLAAFMKTSLKIEKLSGLHLLKDF